MPNTNNEPFRYPDSEYIRCRKIEAPYRELYSNVQFWSNGPVRKQGLYPNSAVFNNVLLFLTTELKYPMPRLVELTPEHPSYLEGTTGLYLSGRLKSQTKTSCRILLRHYASIITLIHEYAHHIVWLDKLKASDDFSIHHGADFLTIEKLLLEIFHQAKKEGYIRL